MHKTFIATALALGMCLPVYAEQFSNSNSDSMLSPVTVDEPNTAVPHREKLDTEKQQGLPIRLTGEHAEYDTVSGDFMPRAISRYRRTVRIFIQRRSRVI